MPEQAFTRREFTKTAALAAAAGLATTPITRAFAQQRRQVELAWRDVADGVRAIFGGGGNAMIVHANSRAVLVDTKNPGLGVRVRQMVEDADYEIAAVINTHHHGDHIGGNNAFADLTVYANQKCIDRVEPQAQRLVASAQRAGEGDFDASDWKPGKALAREEAVSVGRASAVESRHVGPGHTDNDVFLFVPSANVLHTGDLCFNGRHPFIDLNGGASTERWIRSCEAMIDACDDDTVVIPGHGELTDVGGLRRQREFFLRVREAVAKAIQAGKSRDDVLGLDLPVFEGLADNARGKLRTLGTVYQELSAG